MPGRGSSLRGARDLLLVFGVAMVVLGLAMVAAARPLPRLVPDAGFASAVRFAGEEVSDHTVSDARIHMSRGGQIMPVAATGLLAGGSALTSPTILLVPGDRRSYLLKSAELARRNPSHHNAHARTYDALLPAPAALKP